ncbi:hypothetical protein TYRP_001198 [Tyrophagus putrescentiae]|nr:hypothetical protein TYRP_001198 [Tyrophagus putrescentiae]
MQLEQLPKDRLSAREVKSVGEKVLSLSVCTFGPFPLFSSALDKNAVEVTAASIVPLRQSVSR